MTDQIHGSFTRLRSGQWGIRIAVDGKHLPSGQPIMIMRKSGEVSCEIVDRVVWTDGSVSICSIRPSSRRNDATERRDYRGTRWTEY